MSTRQQVQLVGWVAAAFLGIVVLAIHPELLLLGPFGYGASRYRRARTRRMWIERVDEHVRLRREGERRSQDAP
jgi:hypothetical protein